MTTKIMTCTCKHDFQDERYGKNKRVHNDAFDASNNKIWRCTVCLKEKN